MVQPTVTLTAEQIDAFHRDGYLALPALTTAEEVERLQSLYDHLFATNAGRDQGDHLDLVTTDEDDQTPVLPQILNPSKYAPELANTQLRANAEAIARQLLGPEAQFNGEHAILKPPHTEAATPWHQDEAYADANLEEHQHLICTGCGRMMDVLVDGMEGLHVPATQSLGFVIQSSKIYFEGLCQDCQNRTAAGAAHPLRAGRV